MTNNNHAVPQIHSTVQSDGNMSNMVFTGLTSENQK